MRKCMLKGLWSLHQKKIADEAAGEMWFPGKQAEEIIWLLCSFIVESWQIELAFISAVKQ